jgi:hypothetical protein
MPDRYRLRSHLRIRFLHNFLSEVAISRALRTGRQVLVALIAHEKHASNSSTDQNGGKRRVCATGRQNYSLAFGSCFVTAPSSRHCSRKMRPGVSGPILPTQRLRAKVTHSWVVEHSLVIHRPKAVSFGRITMARG